MFCALMAYFVTPHAKRVDALCAGRVVYSDKIDEVIISYCARFRYQGHSGVLRHLCAPWLKKQKGFSIILCAILWKIAEIGTAPSYGPPKEEIKRTSKRN